MGLTVIVLSALIFNGSFNLEKVPRRLSRLTEQKSEKITFKFGFSFTWLMLLYMYRY